MSSENETNISFYLNRCRIHIFKKAIEGIGNPKYIRFRIKPDGTSLVMEQYDRKTLRSLKVPVSDDTSRWDMEVSSKSMCMLLAETFGWDIKKSYRVPGKIYSMQNIVVFDITAAYCINE